MDEDRLVSMIFQLRKELFLAPNEADSHGEDPANIVDGLFAISRAIFQLAETIEICFNK